MDSQNIAHHLLYENGHWYVDTDLIRAQWGLTALGIITARATQDKGQPAPIICFPRLSAYVDTQIIYDIYDEPCEDSTALTPAQWWDMVDTITIAKTLYLEEQLNNIHYQTKERLRDRAHAEAGERPRAGRHARWEDPQQTPTTQEIDLDELPELTVRHIGDTWYTTAEGIYDYWDLETLGAATRSAWKLGDTTTFPFIIDDDETLISVPTFKAALDYYENHPGLKHAPRAQALREICAALDQETSRAEELERHVADALEGGC